jgi:hypothetical protein
MGYILKNGGFLTKTIIVPELQVATLSTLGVVLLDAIAGSYILTNSVVVTAGSNQTTGYTGFNYITVDNNTTIGNYSENISGIGIQLQYYNQLGLNFAQLPEQGSQLKTGKELKLFLDTTPSSGDGDIIITVEYKYVIG